MTVAKKLIYILSDERDIFNTVKPILSNEGFVVRAFNDERSALSTFGETAPDMLIIDIGASGIDELAVCSSIRQKSVIPIILISSLNTEPDIIAGLTAGCDDYLTKPFGSLMLIATVNSLFRRTELDRATMFADNITCVSDIELDEVNMQAFFGDRSVLLTAMEFSLLQYLAVSKGRSVSRRELLDKVWGFENEVETRATDDMMKRIRKKLRDAGSCLKIETVRGFGFKIV